jgi:hypothetical protein
MSMKTQTDGLDCPTLGNHEIERRIDQVGDTLIEGAIHPEGQELSRPRFISAAELVRRVQPFLGMN